MINFQEPEKVQRDPQGSLFVHSIFKTIQGEGPFCGVPAIFVRLAGCNLQCPGCDTDYTSNKINMSALQILTRVKEVVGSDNIKLVVITGGEPFRQNIGPLCDALQGAGFVVQVETNGTLAPGFPLQGDLFIVCSPKTGKVNQVVEVAATCYKYVLSHDSVSPEDGLPLSVLEHSVNEKVARPVTDMEVYIQPMDSGIAEINKLNLQAAIDSCMKFGYTLQLQTHKIIGLS